MKKSAFSILFLFSLISLTGCRENTQKLSLINLAKDSFPKSFNMQLPQGTKVIGKKEIEKWLIQKNMADKKPLPCNLKKFMDSKMPIALFIPFQDYNDILFFELPSKFIREVECPDKWNGAFLLGKAGTCGDAGVCVSSWGNTPGENHPECRCTMVIGCCPGNGDSCGSCN